MAGSYNGHEVVRLAHIGIVGEDAAGLRAFFGDLCGLPTSRRVELPDLGVTATFLACGDREIEIVDVYDVGARRARMRGATSASIEHVGVEVANLDATRAHFGTHGVRLTNSPGASDCGDEPLVVGNTRNLWTVPTPEAPIVVQWIELAR